MLTKKSSSPATVGLVLIALCIACVILRVSETVSSKAESSTNSNTAIIIAPGSSTQHELAAGTRQLFAVSAEAGTLLRFAIDKGDLGLSTMLFGPGGNKLLEHVSQDFEVVEISFPIQVAGTYTIAVQSREKEETRQFELKVELLKTVTTFDRKDSEARQVSAQAEVLRANWKKTPLRQSAEQFDQAALMWRSLRDFTNASRAKLKSADVYFDLSQYGEAQKRSKDALALAKKKRDVLAEARALSQLARLESYSGNNDLAQQYVTQALSLLKQTDSTPAVRNAYGEALTSLGELAQARGNFKKALTHFDEALKSLADDRDGQARVHIFIGYISGSIGNTDKALAEISQALKLYQATNNKVGEAQARSALGLVHSHKENQNYAIELHDSAREIFRAIGDRHSEALANNGLGQAYELLNQPELALIHYQQALRLFESANAMNGIAPTTCYVARAHFASKHLDQALTFYQRCLDLSRNAGMVRHEVSALSELAIVYAAQQRYDLALAQHHGVLKFYESIGDRRGLARALNVYGDLCFQAGKKPQALDAYQRALFLSEQTGEQSAELNSLYGLAHTKLAIEDPEAALSFIQRSLKRIEDSRANVAAPEFRTSYFSGVRKHYELCIKILAQLERLHPGKDFAAQALLVSERSRARLLLDLVNESRANIREGAAKELVDRERWLRGLIRAQAEYQLGLASNQKDPAELAEVETELVQLKAQYQQVEAELRQQSPYLTSLEQFTPLTIEQVQKELGEDTILLEFSLGEEQSCLWVVTSNSIQVYELANRQLIEDAAREYHELLTAWQGAEGQTANEYQARIAAADKALPEKGKALSQILLGQVADKLRSNPRVIVVAEGALQYVPFAALPVPQSVGPDANTVVPLLEINEVVLEPSFSALVAIRKSKSQHSSSPDKLVAVIADPVLNRNDDRVHLSLESALVSADKAETPETLTRDASLARLAHASEEADAISAVAPAGTTMVAKGFDANRETAMSANVGQYQIVHFATHGFLDSEHPELSGIVLTGVDSNGVKTDGLMSLHDIYSLDLSAELTVLSACQTALGKDIRGEGMVGLSHAFMSAGSKSVVSSLWKVDDRATAVLMRDFYESMLQQGMSPAAALRSAQRKMMRDKQYSAPYYWAGFVIQGEYTNRVAVDHRSSLRVALVVLFLVSLVAAGMLIFQRRKRRSSAKESI